MTTTGAYYHATQRLRERYGLSCTRAEYDHLCCTLRDTDPQRALNVLDHGRLVMRVRHAGLNVVAVFDPGSSLIVTFLAPGMIAMPHGGPQEWWRKHSRKQQRERQDRGRRRRW